MRTGRFGVLTTKPWSPPGGKGRRADCPPGPRQISDLGRDRRASYRFPRSGGARRLGRSDRGAPRRRVRCLPLHHRRSQGPPADLEARTLRRRVDRVDQLRHRGRFRGQRVDQAVGQAGLVGFRLCQGFRDRAGPLGPPTERASAEMASAPERSEGVSRGGCPKGAEANIGRGRPSGPALRKQKTPVRRSFSEGGQLRADSNSAIVTQVGPKTVWF